MKPILLAALAALCLTLSAHAATMPADSMRAVAPPLHRDSSAGFSVAGLALFTAGAFELAAAESDRSTLRDAHVSAPDSLRYREAAGATLLVAGFVLFAVHF